MRPTKYFNFIDIIDDIDESFPKADIVPATQWQSIDITKQGELMHMREIRDVSFTVGAPPTTEMITEHPRNRWVADISPNLPWAETAFQERIEGIPWNPGTAWESWPWAKSAKQFKPEQFSHSYAERYWPRLAGHVSDQHYPVPHISDREGIRYEYGDMQDVVNLLARDPLTRQAFLPVWFPEDTGVTHGERVPCTLGYHFILRNDRLHITYYIRSCDFIRHFRDDCYMTLRLQEEVLNQLRNLKSSQDWDYVQLGDYTMHIVSLHMFQNDWNHRYGEK